MSDPTISLEDGRFIVRYRGEARDLGTRMDVLLVDGSVLRYGAAGALDACADALRPIAATMGDDMALVRLDAADPAAADRAALLDRALACSCGPFGRRLIAGDVASPEEQERWGAAAATG